MANSRIVNELKSRLLKDIINNEDIVCAIDSPDKDNPNWDSSCMIDTPSNRKEGFTPLLFNHIKNASTIDKTISFICTEVQLGSVYTSSKWATVKLEVWIFSHNDHMRIENIPKVNANRNDYIAELIDDMVNNKYDIFDTFKLISSVGGQYNDKFHYRKLIFEGKDINYNMCSEEES